MNNTRINPAKLNEGLKNVIVGKGWYPNANSNRPGSVVISRDLPGELVMTAGMTLNMNNNIKREGDKGVNDPDFTVSILLPTAEADNLIKTMQESAADFKKEAATASETPR